MTTRPFRYDLNQILYNYTVEVRNRFKGLDMRSVLVLSGRNDAKAEIPVLWPPHAKS